jgi:hypothetical protein
MLYKELLTEELNQKSEGFRRFAVDKAEDLGAYLEKFALFCRKSYAEIAFVLQKTENYGAHPAEEFDAAEDFTFAFGEAWTNHEDARRWAFGVLQKRTTFAADGSQLFFEREVSLPVGAIQIGWFENPHDETKPYRKNAEFRVLAPEDLMLPDEPYIQETIVGLRRFEAEIDKVSEFLESKKGWLERGERMPLAFYDNTLLLSMSVSSKDFEEDFIEKLVDLVRLSRASRVPLVGYVDRSYARDLMTMLDISGGEKRGSVRTLDDASILHAFKLKNWGDRTPYCYSRRRGLDAFIDRETGKSIVGFVYLQTTSDNVPARIDLPAWIYEDGLLGEVLDTVRAECVIGLGYPYALETADQTAVITLRDREIFLQALQGFAKENNLNLRVSRKAASKGRRR